MIFILFLETKEKSKTIFLFLNKHSNLSKTAGKCVKIYVKANDEVLIYCIYTKSVVQKTKWIIILWFIIKENYFFLKGRHKYIFINYSYL